MAEIVGYQQELMLPVYEEMKKRKLATDAEIREIKVNRDGYEYKLNRQSKSIKDYLEYIAYERQLLRKMSEREKKNSPNDGPDRKFGPVENFLATHVKGLFKQALHLFPHELRLWDSYILYCKRLNYHSEVSSGYEKMLQFHGDEPKNWLSAIEWEFSEIGNMAKVKDLLLRSIQRHPENEELHIQFFKIMLNEAEKMSTELLLENNKTSERDIGLKRVEVIYTSSRNKIANINYLTNILKILEQYPFTKKLQRIVIEDMMTSFPRNELTWHTFANRELKGLNVADVFNDTDENESNENREQDKQQQQQDKQQQEQNQQEQQQQQNESSTARMEVDGQESEQTNKGASGSGGGNSGDGGVEKTVPPSESTSQTSNAEPSTSGTGASKNKESENTATEEIDVKPQLNTEAPIKRTLKRRIELCCKVYETAVRTLKTEAMWNYYINSMLELNRDLTTQAVLKRKKLSDAFKGAYEAELLSQTNFEAYIELLKETKTKKEIIEEIMKKGITLHPNSVRLWELWMEFYAIHDDPKKISEIFREAIKKLPQSESFPLWQLLIRYYLSRRNPNKINHIYREALKHTKPVQFLDLRVKYLEWIYITKDIEKARELYDEITKLPPPYYEFHNRMAFFEANQLQPDIERWRKCHENIIFYFGKERTDVWINYIKFERDHGEAKMMSILFERAKNTLNTDLVNKFISEHSYLSTGIM